MEIEKVFSTIEEIKAEIEKEGFTFRFSFDENEDETEKQNHENEKKNILSSDSMTFATESDPEEIEKWEAALPDIDEDEDEFENENGCENKNGCENENGSEDETRNMSRPSLEKESENKKESESAAVLYFDLFKKGTYVKTLIFQREENELGSREYLLVGFCEAPMS